jgi:hypothetical protein
MRKRYALILTIIMSVLSSLGVHIGHDCPHRAVPLGTEPVEEPVRAIEVLEGLGPLPDRTM